ncbi:MAG: glycosyltransferase family 4 protein [Bdellovibrio sp.]|nr:glycosyltransferase family 4 protein [Bdellovibrio sp.]
MALKILHLVEYLYQGGIERFLSEVARIVPNSVLQQSFFAYEMSDFSGIAKELKNTGRDIRIYKKEYGYDFSLLTRLSRIIREEKIEIIHTHDFGPMEYAVPLKILNPHLILIHTQHTLHHFVINLKYRLFFQFASYFYNKVIAVSEHVNDIVSKKCPHMKNRPTVIHNGVDVEHFSQLKNTTIVGNNALRLVCISRISKEKNLIHILRACNKLKQFNVDFHLHHAGTGTKKEVDSILGFIETNQLGQNITLHGHQDDVREILKHGDIFISSSFTEGHPIAVLEAMASYKLCLCSNIPPHQKISPNGIILFNLDDEHDLFNKLLQISKKQINYSNNLSQAVISISEKYTIQEMINQYINIYSLAIS